mgnify:CR=1 FL=1
MDAAAGDLLQVEAGLGAKRQQALALVLARLAQLVGAHVVDELAGVGAGVDVGV